jgi:hypothetical protein
MDSFVWLRLDIISGSSGGDFCCNAFLATAPPIAVLAYARAPEFLAKAPLLAVLANARAPVL